MEGYTTCYLRLYVVPVREGAITIPFHRCTAEIEARPTGVLILRRQKLEMVSAHRYEQSAGFSVDRHRYSVSSTMEFTRDEIIVSGAGRITVELSGYLPTADLEGAEEIVIRVGLAPALARFTISLTCQMTQSIAEEGTIHWELKNGQSVIEVAPQ